MAAPILIVVVLLVLMAGFFLLQAQSAPFSALRTWGAVFLLAILVFLLALAIHDAARHSPESVALRPTAIAYEVFAMFAAAFSLHGLFRLLSSAAQAAASERRWQAIAVVLGLVAFLALSGRLDWGSALGLGILAGCLVLAEVFDRGNGSER